MIRALALLLALTVAGCSGASAPVRWANSWQQPSVPAGGEVIVSQPDTMPVYNDRSPPRGTVGVTRWAMREWPGDVVSADGVLSISIDSSYSTEAVLNKGTIVLGSNLAAPLQGNFLYSFDMKVTHASVTGGAVAHVVAYYSFCRRGTKECRWNGLIVFDTRCGRTGTVEKWDRGTNRGISNVVYPGYSCRPHDWRSFAFAPTIALAVDDELRGIVWNPETHTAQGEHARIDVSIRNWKLARIP